MQREHQMQEALAKKIQAMESKLLVGGDNIIDHTNEQQRALEKRRQEIADQRVGATGFSIFSSDNRPVLNGVNIFFQNKERELEQKRQELEETAGNVTGNFESLQQEVDIKTKKLKKVMVQQASVHYSCFNGFVWCLVISKVARRKAGVGGLEGGTQS